MPQLPLDLVKIERKAGLRTFSHGLPHSRQGHRDETLRRNGAGALVAVNLPLALVPVTLAHLVRCRDAEDAKARREHAAQPVYQGESRLC